MHHILFSIIKSAQQFLASVSFVLIISRVKIVLVNGDYKETDVCKKPCLYTEPAEIDHVSVNILPFIKMQKRVKKIRFTG